MLDAIPTVHPYAAMLTYASVARLVCGDLNSEKYKGYWVQDCSAARENILLAAMALGLGAVWTGVHPMADQVNGMRRLFGLRGLLDLHLPTFPCILHPSGRTVP